MSMYDPNAAAPASQQGTAGGTDIVTALQGIMRQLSALVQAFQGRTAFGTFTLAAAATTTINDTAVKGNSQITFVPTNAAAATLMGSAKALYISARAAGTSFTVATGDASAAIGTETFSYAITTPQ